MADFSYIFDDEMYVFSSWIDSLQYDKSTNTTTMTLLSGAQYDVHDMDSDTFQDWVTSSSKGKFFHLRVLYEYHITPR